MSEAISKQVGQPRTTLDVPRHMATAGWEADAGFWLDATDGAQFAAAHHLLVELGVSVEIPLPTDYSPSYSERRGPYV